MTHWQPVLGRADLLVRLLSHRVHSSACCLPTWHGSWGERRKVERRCWCHQPPKGKQEYMADVPQLSSVTDVRVAGVHAIRSPVVDRRIGCMHRRSEGTQEKDQRCGPEHSSS